MADNITPIVKDKQKWDWKKELETNQYMGSVQRQIIERLHDPSYMPFSLDKSYVKHYKHVKPPFGFNGFGELVYMRTYSRLKDDGSNEMWPETVERVVNGTFNLQKRWIQSRGLEWSDYKAQKSAQEMYDRMFKMKFLPPGRGLWAMGSEVTEERGLYSALNNCFAYETEILTRDGFKKIGDLNGTTPFLLSKNENWTESEIKSFGKQKLKKLTLQRQGVTKEVFVTDNHIWFAKSPSEINHHKGFQQYKTCELKQKFRLQYMFGQKPSNFSPQGIQHGICFGDGTVDHLYLIGEKDKQLLQWFSNNELTKAPEKNAIRVAHLPRHYKQLPSINYDRKYLLGWLMGYFAADGSCDKNGQITLCSANKENLIFAKNAAAICGLGTYSLYLSSESSNFSDNRELWKLNFMSETMFPEFFLIKEHKDNFVPTKKKVYWNVVSVEDTNREEEVFCAVVPELKSFVIEGNILTHNCAFVSTEEIKEDLSKPFRFLMDMSMVGVGVGFDTKGAGKIMIRGPDKRRSLETFVIPDTREGWVEATGRLIDSYLLGIQPIRLDYGGIRPLGRIIGGFGGKSSGSGPLQDLHKDLEGILEKDIGKPITSRTIVDISNLIGRCVVAGNVRRTAELALGEIDDETFLDLKNYEMNPERASYGWTSNNSISAALGMNYEEVAERIRLNGEPGVIWMQNVKDYGRMGSPKDGKDHRAKGCNPCVEQSLESYELCNLVENFPNNHANVEDFLRTLKFAYMYAKTVTLGETHWPETNRVLLRNRRIGCSVSGVAQFVASKGLGTLKEWLEKGYDEIDKWDEIYSEWMTVPKSIKKTSVKPSGSVSSVAGATSGMHWPISEYYIRRMRLSKSSELVEPIRRSGYHLEDSVDDTSSLVVEFPVHVGTHIRSEQEVSMWEQLGMASFLQKHWSDNQVSCTIKFDPEKEGKDIADALDYFQYQLKGISMLPKREGVYKQPPYEPITKEKYAELSRKIKPLDFSKVKHETTEVERFCTNDSCELQPPISSAKDTIS